MAASRTGHRSACERFWIRVGGGSQFTEVARGWKVVTIEGFESVDLVQHREVLPCGEISARHVISEAITGLAVTKPYEKAADAKAQAKRMLDTVGHRKVLECISTRASLGGVSPRWDGRSLPDEIRIDRGGAVRRERIIIENRAHRRRYEREFERVFSMGMNPFWDDVSGFDSVAFEERLVEPPEGTTTRDAILSRWGVDGVRVFCGLLGIDSGAFLDEVDKVGLEEL